MIELRRSVGLIVWKERSHGFHASRWSSVCYEAGSTYVRLNNGVFAVGAGMDNLIWFLLKTTLASMELLWYILVWISTLASTKSGMCTPMWVINSRPTEGMKDSWFCKETATSDGGNTLNCGRTNIHMFQGDIVWVEANLPSYERGWCLLLHQGPTRRPAETSEGGQRRWGERRRSPWRCSGQRFHFQCSMSTQ